VFLNIIQIANKFKVKEIFYASSSSVYGQQKNIDLKENLVPKPIQFYAVSKLTNENMAQVYSSLYNIRFIGMRFFTVYGPWGRPDMALFKFTKNIIENKKITLFNQGLHRRNFSYVEDVVEIIFRLSNIKIKFKHEIFNIANKNNYTLKEYIYWIEKIIGKKSKKQLLKLQQGDVANVRADINKITKLIKFKNFTSLTIGVKKFITWYKNYYNVKN
jgi:UDP-glucuronate 4-epimerase